MKGIILDEKYKECLFCGEEIQRVTYQTRWETKVLYENKPITANKNRMVRLTLN